MRPGCFSRKTRYAVYMERLKFIVIGVMIMLAMHMSYANSGDEEFFEKINADLDAVATTNGLSLSYEEVIFKSDPMIDDYYSIIAPRISFSDNQLTYTLHTRNIGLKNIAKNEWKTMIPMTVYLQVAMNGSTEIPDSYELRLRGAPKATLKTDANGIREYQVESVEGMQMDIALFKKLAADEKRENFRPKPLVSKRLEFNDVKDRPWKPFNTLEIPNAELVELAHMICLSVNNELAQDYPDYEPDGCGWKKR